MNIGFCRIRWAESLLLAAVAVLALAPQPAAAHGGHADHRDVRTPVAGPHAAAVAVRAAGEAASVELSQPCPSGPGGRCCCGSRPVCSTAGQITLVSSGGWWRPVPSPAVRVQWPEIGPAPLAQFAPSPALPRAPPHSS